MKTLVDKGTPRGGGSQSGGRGAKEVKVIGPPAAAKMLVMTNKTPFWNEQSQVYQVNPCKISKKYKACVY